MSMRRLLNSGVSVAAFYIGSLGMGIAAPVQYVETGENTAVTQAVQEAQASKLHVQEELSATHLNQLQGNVTGGAWFSGHEKQIREALENISLSPIGASVLAKVSDTQVYRVLNKQENKVFASRSIEAAYSLDLKQVLFSTWALDEIPHTVETTVLHETQHVIQDQNGATVYRETTSPYVYSLGEQLIEADAVATELAYFRERGVPEALMFNGRERLAPAFNKMWQENYNTCQDEAKANEMTRKQFIQKMILNQNPRTGLSDSVSADEKCDYQISSWKRQYQPQININFDVGIKKKIESGLSVSIDVQKDQDLMDKVAAVYGFSKAEMNQMYRAVCEQDQNIYLDMAAVSLAKGPKSMDAYKNGIVDVEKGYLADMKQDGALVASQKLKNQVDDVYFGVQKGGLLKTLSKAAAQTAENGGMEKEKFLDFVKNSNLWYNGK